MATLNVKSAFVSYSHKDVGALYILVLDSCFPSLFADENKTKTNTERIIETSDI